MFLLMFSVATGVLIFALFFDFRLPLKENEVLKAENEKIIGEFNFQKVFTERIEYVGKLMDSIDQSPERFPYLEQSINVELVDLKRKADSLEGSKLYENVLINFGKLLTTKKTSVQTNDTKSIIDKLTEENKALEAKSSDLSIKLQICEQISKN